MSESVTPYDSNFDLLKIPSKTSSGAPAISAWSISSNASILSFKSRA